MSQRTPPAATREHHLLSRRTSFRRSLTDNAALPAEYLDRLENKRKQLDDSIHKYIAAKERDYKLFEKELRNEHRIAQGQAGVNVGVRKRSSRDGVRDDGKATAPARGRSKEHDDGDEVVDDALDRAAITGLQDRRCSVERDQDFVGLFMPAFLPAIDDRSVRELERTTSAPSPPTVASTEAPDRYAQRQERSHSDSLVQAKPRRPSQLALTQRTSSSGSSADGRLASAMKSPSQQPKRKRVSLAVGDTIVAPSDNVPVVPSTSKTPSHSRQRSGARRELTLLSQETTQSSPETPNPGQAPTTTDLLVTTTENPALTTSPPPTTNSTPGSRPSAPPAGRLDPDGDLFDLEAVEEVPITPADNHDLDDFEDAVESDDDDPGEPSERLNSPMDDIPLTPSKVRYDPTTGVIPEPTDGTDSAVPYLAFGPSSAVASQQPTKPGFRRPSVIDDPVYRGRDYQMVEQDAVENEIYGSRFAEAGSKSSFTAGSLGESYMAAHAAEMMRTRGARAQTEVES